MAVKPRHPAAVLLATGFYISYIPVKLTGGRRALDGQRWTGAGLLGTLEGLLLLPLLPRAPAAFALAWGASLAASCWICTLAERALGEHDDPRIVLDEIVGFWTAAAFLPPTGRVLAAAFALFRLFDAVKPPPCRWLERLPEGLGVVADDVGAGLMANLLLRGLLALAPSWLS